jgi:hypothetical protein
MACSRVKFTFTFKVVLTVNKCCFVVLYDTRGCIKSNLIFCKSTILTFPFSTSRFRVGNEVAVLSSTFSSTASVTLAKQLSSELAQ